MTSSQIITKFIKNIYMKKRNILFTLCFLSVIFTKAQESPVGMKDEFNTVSKYTSRSQTGFEGLQGYSSGQAIGSQFFWPNWSKGQVVTINNDTIKNNYLFLYDKVRQEVFIKVKDTNLVLLADKGQIASFTLFTDKRHFFVPASKYDKSKKDIFYEVLAKSDSGYALLKLITTKFIKADKTNIEKAKNGEFDDEFVDEITYYISYKSGIPQKIKLNERSITKQFPAIAKVVNDYFYYHRDQEINDSLLIDLFNTINGQP